jgi:hypothetical protein
MSNFAARNLSLGQVNALWKKLGGEAAVLGIIAGTLKFTLEAVEGQPYNGSTFFQTQSGRWVDSDLDRYVGLDGHTRGTLPVGRVLKQNTAEADMFGKLGTTMHEETLKNACDLGQIGELIAAQEGGKPGTLLNNGYANIFPVRGKDGALRVVYVLWSADDREWRVYCGPFDPDFVWRDGRRVFSN